MLQISRDIEDDRDVLYYLLLSFNSNVNREKKEALNECLFQIKFKNIVILAVLTTVIPAYLFV